MYKIVKRLFDFCSALFLLIIISPLFILLIVLVALFLGLPVFFKQKRTGRDRKVFNIVKFRTMTNATDTDGNLLPDDQRFTRFGKWLRSSSLDELPELINIIRGDMSVIGPRPLPRAYDSFYRENELARFNVRGGLITPDSIDPNPIISWDEQFKYEADYGQNMSFRKDWNIFWGVFRILFRRTQNNYGSYVRKPLNIERGL